MGILSLSNYLSTISNIYKYFW